MQTGRVDIITMGCSKNLVDSERLLRRVAARGYRAVHDSPDVRGEYVVVNTCGFIGDAKQESIDMILRLAEGKRTGRIGRLFVMGCLSERYRSVLPAELPEVDAWFGKFDWDRILDLMPLRRPAPVPLRPWARRLTTPSWSAFMKISEGCDRFCAYCAIPLITGRHRSRPVEEILEETRQLVRRGVKEFNVIAQDLSAYGTDLPGGRSRLAELVEGMADIRGVEWIRLHYAYPVGFPWDVMKVMRERPNVCNYLDIALQHISNPVLDNMRRHITSAETYDLIERLRDEVPGLRLRTTLMTGFPGEGEREFEELMDFVKRVRFDRMGAFAYCEEEDTWAARHLRDTVPEEVKQHRLKLLMEAQEEISAELHSHLIGETVKVLVEENDGMTLTGRTQWDSPEVDPQVVIPLSSGRGEGIEPGSFIQACVTASAPFELYATPVD